MAQLTIPPWEAAIFLLTLVAIFGIGHFFLIRHCIGLYKEEIQEHSIIQQHQVSRLQTSLDTSNRHFDNLFGKVNGH